MIPGPKANKDCKKLEPFLDDYLRGELPRATADRLASHLETCGNCREALEDLRISAKLVTGAFEERGEPSPGFARLVMARINTAEQWVQQQTSFWRPIEALSLRLVFSAALALIFLFAYGLRVRNAPVVTAPEPSGIFVQQTEAFQPTSFSPSPSNNDEVLMAIAERHHEQH
ncbi:MAG TPA: zf-HC2 domain-containing protein [Candidatus Acidoferrales bacterium]|nr:zf-HC2 domain-containing protein [Candidatus Acidoferrales bacterium]